MTAKLVTWLGEDQGDTPGPSFNVWAHHLSGTTTAAFKFDKGAAVLIDDEAGEPAQRALAAHILAMAPTNRFYQVEDAGKKKAPAHSNEEHDEEDDEEDHEDIEAAHTRSPHRAVPQHPPKRKK